MSDRWLPLPLSSSRLEHRLPDHQPRQVHNPSYPLMLAGQLPQECEGNGQVDQEGAAGDGGGQEQGGGQATSTGAICMVYEKKALVVEIHFG